jgi:hypothetical protein
VPNSDEGEKGNSPSEGCWSKWFTLEPSRCSNKCIELKLFFTVQTNTPSPSALFFSLIRVRIS